MMINRLLDFAGNYYDIKDFPDGEAKRSLIRLINKRSGKQIVGGNTNAGSDRDNRPKKKKKRDN